MFLSLIKKIAAFLNDFWEHCFWRDIYEQNV